MTWGLIATPCQTHDGRRLALLAVPSEGIGAARLHGPGLPANGRAVADLPDGGAWRLVDLPGQAGSWQVREDGTSIVLDIPAWPAVPEVAHLIHFGHCDFGWADLPDAMRPRFVQDLDLAIAACEATAGAPDGERFIWNLENSTLAQDYLAARGAAEHARLAALIATERIEIGAFTSSVVQTVCDPEEIMRLCDRAVAIAQRLGGTVTSAQHNDVPGLHPRLAAAMAGAGVKYLTWGANAQYSLNHDGHVPRCFRWRPDGRHEVQVWRHSQDPHLGGYAAGSHILAALDRAPAAGAAALARLLAGLVEPALPAVLVSLGADFMRPVPAAVTLVAWWNAHFLRPRVRMSTNTQAHRDLAARCAGRLPVVEGQFPDAWVSLPLGTPDLTVLARRSSLALRRAEQVAVWCGLSGTTASDLNPGRISEGIVRHYEHTYGLEGLCDRYLPATLDDFAQVAGPLRAADEELRVAAWRGRSALGRRFAGGGKDGLLLPVLNHLPRARHGLVRVRLHARHLPRGRAWCIRDVATGAAVPAQLDRPLGHHENLHQTTVHHYYELMFLAEDVPALGYKLFRLEPATSAAAREACALWTPGPGGAPAARLAWNHGQLDIDQATGAVAAWRWPGGELLAPAEGLAPLLGECRLLGYQLNCARPKDFTDNDRFYRLSEVLRPRLEDIAPLPAGPLSGGYRAEAVLGSAARLSLYVRVQPLTSGLDVELHVERSASLPVEALAIAWPAAVSRPAFACDAGGLDLDPQTAPAPGAYRDLIAADRWAAVHGPEGALIVCSPDAPVTSFGGMNLLTWRRTPLAEPAPQLWSMLSLNGHWRCGNVSPRNRESGRWNFHVTPQARFDPLAAQAASEDVAFPLVCDPVEESDADAPWSAPAASLVSLEEEGRTPVGVQVLALRPSAGGFALRLAERAGRDRRLRLRVPSRAITVDLALPAWGVSDTAVPLK